MRNGTVLVLGTYRQTVTVVRSLARAGHRVVVGRHGRRASTELSRYTAEVWVHPDPEKTRRLVEALQDLLAARSDIDTVFPVSEVEIQPLLGWRRELSSRVAIVLPGSEALETCLDKRRTCALARELGVPLPRTCVVSGIAELDRAVGDLGFPLVVKRPDSIVIGGKKAVICVDRRDLDAWRQAIAAERAPLVLQAWVPGDRHNCQFAAREGEIFAYFQQKVLRTDERDGTGLGVDGVSVAPSPALRRHCEALVRRLSYTGVGCIQFLVDSSSGGAALLEWNPRLDATCDLPYRCGFDFPLLALRLAGSDPERARTTPVPGSYPIGRRIYWLAGDVKALPRQLRAREIGGADFLLRVIGLLTFPLRRAYHLGWSWSDPMPTLFLGWRAVGRALRAARRRLPASHPARVGSAL